MGRRSNFKRIFGGVMALGGIAILWSLASLDPAPIYAPFSPPGPGHLMGTDASGHDILRLLARASATSLAIGIAAALGATLIGALVGCAAGYWRGLVDELLMRLTDIFLLIPTLPLVVVLGAYLGPGVGHITLLIALTAWPATARVVRARVLSLREAPFVINARSMGAGSAYLIARHILPNCGELLQAKASLAVAGAMLAEAGLGFLGLGDPIHPSWGSMIHDAFIAGALVNGYWWWILPPMGLISLFVAGFNLAAGTAFNPRRAQRGGASVIRGPESRPSEAGPQMDASETPPLLAVSGLTVRFGNSFQARPVVDSLHLSVQAGQKIALVGASGSGKSLLLLAILGLLPQEATSAGQVFWRNENIAVWDSARRRRYRGMEAAYLPQGAGAALNPLLPITRQVAERCYVHLGTSRNQAMAKALVLLQAAGLKDARRYGRAYPHHLSGGMKQRVLLAMAMAGDPALILADEPTKGLDPEAVAGVLRLFRSLEKEAVLAITHDLGFAAALGGRVVVMYAGMVVENIPAQKLLEKPHHPYTRALVAAQPVNGLRPPPAPKTAVPWIADGCPFRHRCPEAYPQCTRLPPLFDHGGHAVRCWRHAA